MKRGTGGRHRGLLGATLIASSCLWRASERPPVNPEDRGNSGEPWVADTDVFGLGVMDTFKRQTSQDIVFDTELLELGDIPRQCPTPFAVRLINPGPTEVVLGAFSVEGGLTLIEPPAPGTVLGARGSLRIRGLATPDAATGILVASLGVALADQAWQPIVTVRGMGKELATGKLQWSVPAPPVSILGIVGATPGHPAARSLVADTLLNRVLPSLDEMNIPWNLGLHAGGGDACLRSGLITHASASRTNAVTSAVAPLAVPSLSAEGLPTDQQLLERMVAILELSRPGGCNAGLVPRAPAIVNVVLVTDQLDQTPGSAEGAGYEGPWLARARAALPPGVDLRISVVQQTSAGECGIWDDPGGLIAATYSTGGTVTRVCDLAGPHVPSFWTPDQPWLVAVWDAVYDMIEISLPAVSVPPVEVELDGTPFSGTLELHESQLILPVWLDPHTQLPRVGTPNQPVIVGSQLDISHAVEGSCAP